MYGYNYTLHVDRHNNLKWLLCSIAACLVTPWMIWMSTILIMTLIKNQYSELFWVVKIECITLVVLFYWCCNCLPMKFRHLSISLLPNGFRVYVFLLVRFCAAPYWIAWKDFCWAKFCRRCLKMLMLQWIVVLRRRVGSLRVSPFPTLQLVLLCICPVLTCLTCYVMRL